MSKIILGYTSEAEEISESILMMLKEENIEVEVVSLENIYDTSIKVGELVLKEPNLNKGIIIDDYGIAPFISAGKMKGIICAQLNDEHSAFMTRDHNNTNVISLGHLILGEALIKPIVKRFVSGNYAGGRHQIRVDMLNEMGGLSR